MATPYDKAMLELYPAISDLRALAQKRIPFLSWEYLESGTGDEYALPRNTESFRNVIIPPAILKGEIQPDLTTSLLGVSYSAPFGIAPVGLTGLIWPGAEFDLARSAEANRIPYCLSTVATQTPEDVGPLVGDMGWFQLYPPREEVIRKDLLARAKASGFDTLVVTADVPVPSRRERTKRAGLRMPPKTTAKMAWDAVTHPAWLKGMLKYGSPSLKTIEKYLANPTREATAQYVNDNLGGTLSWEYLAEVRAEWSGPLLLKGVLTADDAKKAVAAGVDAIIVSNHGGRQFDAAPAALDVLPDLIIAINGRIPVIFDSGVRSGTDIVKALYLGADFVLLGRAFLYGMAALGHRGADHVYHVLVEEIKNNMLQLGCANIQAVREL